MFALLAKFNRYLNHHEYLLLLLLLVVILRLPTLFEPFWYGDENIYLAIGQGVRHGQILYSQITDFPNKPPAIYLLSALATNVTNLRLILILATLLGTSCFFILSRRIFSLSSAFFLTLAFIFLTSTPLIEGTIANAENFFIVPILLVLVLLTTKPGRRQPLATRPSFHFVSGLLLSLAFLFKIHAALDIIAITIFFYLFPHSLKELQKHLVANRHFHLFVLGLALPVTITVLFLAIIGVSPTSLVFNATGSAGYVSVWQASDFLTQYLLFGSLTARILLWLTFTLLLYFSRRRLPPFVTFSLFWLVSSLFAALLSARPYPHYLLQVVAPFLLVVGYLFLHPSRLIRVLSLAGITLVLASFVRFNFSFWSVVPYYRHFFTYVTGQADRTSFYRTFDRRVPRNYALATRLRQLTLPGEQIYVWGNDPEVYVMSNRLPATKLVTSFHVNDLDYYQTTLNHLEANPPAAIVIMENEPLPFPELQAHIDTSYLLVERIGDPGLSAQANQGHRALVYKRL